MRTFFSFITIALFLAAGMSRAAGQAQAADNFSARHKSTRTIHLTTHPMSRSTNHHPARATARYAPWKICIDEPTITRFVMNTSLLLAAGLLGNVTVADVCNSYDDDEGSSFKMLFNFMAGCAGMSVLFDRLVNSCPECPHCTQGSLFSSLHNFSQDAVSESEDLLHEAQSFVDMQAMPAPESVNSGIDMIQSASSGQSAASQELEDITALHKTGCFLYNISKIASVLRLGRSIYDVFAEDRDFGSKCVVLPAALIGMKVILKDLHESYQEYKNSSGRYSKCIVS